MWRGSARLRGTFALFASFLLVASLPAATGMAAAPAATLAGHEVQPHRTAEGRPIRNAKNQLESSNWSGYVLAQYETGQTYTAATASWTVPNVTVPAGSSAGYSSSWVGAGGFCLNATCSKVDKSLIQLGTEQDASSGGTTRYYAWYETLPQYPVLIPLTVHPGDAISASLQVVGKTRTGQVWRLNMTDQTTGQSWQTNLNYKSSLASVEWIEEAPYSGGVLPLANFDIVTFDPGTANGRNPALASSDGVIMLNPNGQTSNVSGPDGDTDGFNACWGSGITLTACSAPAS